MQENRGDEAEPLIRFCGLGAVGEGGDAHAEAAEVVEGAEARCGCGEGCSVGAVPGHFGGAEVGAVDDVGAHAGDEAGAHVDEDVGGGADHGVEGGVDFDGGAG